MALQHSQDHVEPQPINEKGFNPELFAHGMPVFLNGVNEAGELVSEFFLVNSVVLDEELTAVDAIGTLYTFKLELFQGENPKLTAIFDV